MKEFYESTAKQLILNISFPYVEMLEEAKKLSSRYIPYRLGDGSGWESITLHGLGFDKTASSNAYGYTSETKAEEDMFWTEIAEECPITLDFLQNKFPAKKYNRVRFMKLKAGGYIGSHSDARHPLLENINLALNTPDECFWRWDDDGEEIWMEPGKAHLMNIHYRHSVHNRSNEDRYHLIISRADSTDEWKKILVESAKSAKINGKFITIENL